MGKTRGRKSPNSTNALNEAVTVTRGDHLCALYAIDHERLLLAVPFVLDGLREGSVCFLIGPHSSTSEILAELKESGIDIDRDIGEGRLVVAEHQNSTLGQFEFFETRTSAAERAGLNTFRLFADMIGARRHMSVEQVLDIERGFDDVIVHKHQMAAMCAYDVRGFSGIELLAALRTHRGSVRYTHDDTREKATK